PVSEVALWPRSMIAIATSAQEIRSPTEASMSSSRGAGWSEISCARRIRSSVVPPIAETTATTRLPASLAAAQRRATRFSRSVSPTDVPPNFITTRPGERCARSFLLTAFGAWHRHSWLSAAAAATGALLVADAWFDIVLESRSNDLELAVVEAVLAELPLALVCFWIAYVTSRADRRALDQA